MWCFTWLFLFIFIPYLYPEKWKYFWKNHGIWFRNSAGNLEMWFIQENVICDCLNQYSEIPGFYYDTEKKKYFRILPGQNVSCDNIPTRENIKAKKEEELRQYNLLKAAQNKAPQTNIHPQCGHRYRLSVPNYSSNQCKLVDQIAWSYLSEKRQPFRTQRNEVIKHCAAQLKHSGCTKIFVNPNGPYEKMEHMLMMKPNHNRDKLLCLWSLKELIVQRIQMLAINKIGKSSEDGATDIDILPIGAVLLQSFSKVTGMCWAPLNGGDEEDDCILYTTTCFLGNNPSLALLRRLDSDNAEGFRHTEFNLGQKATWACAWNTLGNCLSVGSERCGLLLDVPTRKMWELNTFGSDVYSQIFSHNVSIACFLSDLTCLQNSYFGLCW